MTGRRRINMRGLGAELAELERTDPAVKVAAENYDLVRDQIIAAGQEEAPRERGILFSPPMIRALLAGWKTQTRRIAKLSYWPRAARGSKFGPGPQFYPVALDGFRIGHAGIPARQCPYGVQGDRLWVREGWRPTAIGSGVAVKYLADGSEIFFSEDRVPAGWVMPKAAQRGRAVTSLYMPRWAARLVLEVTEVRLERVTAISRVDAMAEGFEPGMVIEGTVNGDPIVWYGMLWDVINGEGSFASDPMVWAVSFRLIERPARAIQTRTTTAPGGSDGNEARK